MADTTRNITEFFETDYKDFAQYVIENRALISVIDGLKTGARKIMHAAFIGSLKDYKQKKVPNLSGETMNFSLYPHGDMSLNSTIVTLSQEHKFNLNPLYIDSQNGSLRDDSVSSPRYLYVKLSKYAKLWKADIELTERIFEEGQYTEPKYYLPIIPVAILNRQEGMCQGFRFSTMSYNPIDVIDACKKYLTDKAAFEKCTIHPYVRGIKKTNWIKQKDGSWVNVGEYSWDPKKRIVRITDLPYDVEYKDFEKLLNKMVDALDIKEWFNFSEDGNVDYRIDCSRGDLYEEIKKDPDSVIVSKFKLAKVLPADLLWVLDENKKVLHFENIKDLIAYFIDFRLARYKERKSRLVKIMEEKYKENSDLVKFINLICGGKLKINGRKKDDISVDMKKHDLDMKLLSTPMSKCTVEERDELLKKNQEIKEELEYIKKTSETQMYINDLDALRGELSGDFK
jgi:DNA topoisomerase-2